MRDSCFCRIRTFVPVLPRRSGLPGQLDGMAAMLSVVTSWTRLPQQQRRICSAFMPSRARSTVPHCFMPGQVTVLPSQYSVKYGSTSPVRCTQVLNNSAVRRSITAKTVRPLTQAWSYPGEPVMLKLQPRLGYHSVQIRFSARLTCAIILARRASSGQESGPHPQNAIASGRKKCYNEFELVYYQGKGDC